MQKSGYRSGLPSLCIRGALFIHRILLRRDKQGTSGEASSAQDLEFRNRDCGVHERMPPSSPLPDSSHHTPQNFSNMYVDK